VFLESNPEWTLVVAGRGEDTASLKALVHELGLFEHVLFVGFLNQQENHAYYCRSKIYISIPKSDSISISLVEAILCGCVPFVSDLVANRELIKNGENGFIEEDLGDIDFGKYTQINKKDMQKTREHLASTFSKAYNAKRYFKIYDEVCV
jgi:glycosyltransferase involved in cell wall biosynthesis